MSVFRRRRPVDSSVERALRASLAAQARQAPNGSGLPERILAAVDSPPPELLEQPRRWVGWALPAVAAAAAVAAVAVGISVVGNSGKPGVPTADKDHSHRFGGNLHGSTLAVPTHVTTPPSTGTASAPESVGVPNVRVRDLTFAGTNDGWALATATCQTGRCTELLRTHDGTHWSRLAAPPFRYPAVAHIRFATDAIGYAFGPGGFFMTTTGGRTWQRQPGGALALETLDGNVVRVIAHGTGCPAYCHVQVETAAIGSPTWTVAPIPESVPNSLGGYGISFARGGSDVYLLSLGHPAGGSSRAYSTLYRSTDDGHTWQSMGEPCPQVTREVDSLVIGAGMGDRVSVLCMTRQPHYGRLFVATSTDAGSHFTAHGLLPKSLTNAVFGAPDTTLVGDPSTVLALAGIDGGAGPALLLSDDGGATWQLARDVPGGVTFVGFENSQVGRVVAQHGRSIWTTRDGGRTWTPITFH